MSIAKAFGISSKSADRHFMNDGVLSPEYSSAPTDYFSFSVVRNPWDRFISGWKYCTSTQHKSLHDVLTNLPQEGYDYRHLTRPQHAILYDESGRLVVDYLIRFESLQEDFDHVCDLIGKPRCILPNKNRGVGTDVSNQSSHMRMLRRMYALVRRKRVSPLGNPGSRAERKHYSEYFDEYTQQLFMQHFGRDVELFDYQY